jgi:hypothetical protein
MLQYIIKMNLIEIGCDGVDWIYLAQDMGQWWAFVNMVMNLPVTENARNFFSS